MVFKKRPITYKQEVKTDAIPQGVAAENTVAATPQMQMPTNRPVIPTPQPQQQPAVQPDAAMANYAPQPQQVAVTPQMQMPTGQPYTDYMRKPDIQPAAPVSVVPQTVPQEQIQSQRLEQMKGAPISVVPGVPEPSQEPLQTKALEQASPAYWQKYGGVNWNANGGDFFANAAEANIPIQDAIKYYDLFQKDNGGKELDPWDVYARYGDKDFSKSIKQQEEEDKKLERQHKWEKLGDAFVSLANLWGTMRGAPNIPLESGEALTKRQQEQVDRVRTLRQAAGKRYLDALQQKKAEEFKRKQIENEDKRLKDNEQYRRDMLAARSDEAQKKDDRERQKLADAKENNKEKNEIAKENAKSRRMSAQAAQTSAAKKENKGGGSRGGSGTDLEEVTTSKKIDKNGNITTTEKVKKKRPVNQAKKKLGLY